MQWRSAVAGFVSVACSIGPCCRFPFHPSHVIVTLLLRVILEACFPPLFYHVPVASPVSDLSILYVSGCTYGVLPVAIY